jgi:hypothetical protein
VLRGKKLARKSVGAQETAPLPRDLGHMADNAQAINEGACHQVAEEQLVQSPTHYSSSFRLP